MKELKRVYERPALSITEISSGDIILVSVFDTLITADELLGQGAIKWIEIDYN